MVASDKVSDGVAAEPEPRPPGEPDPNQRYHALDFLRATLMLSAIALHAATAYATLPAFTAPWPTSEYLTPIASGAFRMPIFFVLAGFFCSLLYSRRTLPGFASNALVRIGIPLVIGWAVLSPFVGGGTAFSAYALFIDRDLAWPFAWGLMKDGEFFFLDSTMHLWFLYYLLIFYAIFVVVRTLAAAMNFPESSRAHDWVKWLFERPWRVALFAIPTIAILQVQPLRESAVPASWTPGLGFLLLYGFFFTVGALLFSVRGVLDEFKRGAWLSLLAGVGLFAAYSLVQADQYTPGAEGRNVRAIMDITNGLFIWLLFVGSVGLLLRYLNRAMRPVRYIADASYWCYTIHLGFGVWLPGLLVDYAWAPEVKFLAVYAIMTSVSFATYELFVRWSIIGRVFNGRTYPSGLAVQLRRLRGRLSDSPAVPVT